MVKKIKLHNYLDIKDYLEQIQAYNIDVLNNQIFLFGEDSYINESGNEPGIEFSMANRLLKNLQICLSLNPKKPLIVQMKTCGGDWQEGMAIYDALKAYPNPVIILSETHARSMSSIILQAGTIRYILENSVFMFHYGDYADSGDFKTVKSTFEFHDRVATPKMLEIYTQSMLKSKKFKSYSVAKCQEILKEKMDKKGDVFLTAQEALEWGFADKILKSWHDMNTEVKKWQKN